MASINGPRSIKRGRISNLEMKKWTMKNIRKSNVLWCSKLICLLILSVLKPAWSIAQEAYNAYGAIRGQVHVMFEGLDLPLKQVPVYLINIDDTFSTEFTAIKEQIDPLLDRQANTPQATPEWIAISEQIIGLEKKRVALFRKNTLRTIYADNQGLFSLYDVKPGSYMVFIEGVIKEKAAIWKALLAVKSGQNIKLNFGAHNVGDTREVYKQNAAFPDDSLKGHHKVKSSVHDNVSSNKTSTLHVLRQSKYEQLRTQIKQEANESTGRSVNQKMLSSIHSNCIALCSNPIAPASVKQLLVIGGTIPKCDLQAGVYSLYALGNYSQNIDALLTVQFLQNTCPDNPYISFLEASKLYAVCSKCSGEGTITLACHSCKGTGKCWACNGTGKSSTLGSRTEGGSLGQKSGFKSTASSSSRSARTCYICQGGKVCLTCKGGKEEHETCKICRGTKHLIDVVSARHSFAEVLTNMTLATASIEAYADSVVDAQKLKALLNDTKAVSAILKEARSRNGDKAAIDKLSTAIREYPDAPNIAEAQTLLTQFQSRPAEVIVMSPALGYGGRSGVTGAGAFGPMINGLAGLDTSERRLGGGAGQTGGGGMHFPDPQTAMNAAGRLNSQLQGSMDSAREMSIAGGQSMTLPAATLNRWKVIRCPVHDGCWTLQSFGRTQQSRGLYDAYNDASR